MKYTKLYALFPETLKEPNILRDARANRQPETLVLLPKTSPFPFQPEQQGTRRPPHLVRIAFSRPDHARERVALEGPLELAHDGQQAARDAERLAFLVRQHTRRVQRLQCRGTRGERGACVLEVCREKVLNARPL